MEHLVNIADDIRAVLLRGGSFMPALDIQSRVAPLHGKEVRAAIRSLVKLGELQVLPGGGGWPAYYGRPQSRLWLRRL